MTVQEILMTTIEKMPGHAASFVVREGRGSYVPGVDTQEKLIEFFNGLTFEEVPHSDLEEGQVNPVCTYYRFQMPEGAGAVQAITSVGDLLAGVEQGEALPLTVRRSGHDNTVDGEQIPALELVYNGAPLELFKPVDFGMVIVGPSAPGNDDALIYTWHPGALASAPTKDLCDTIAGIVVKLAA